MMLKFLIKQGISSLVDHSNVFIDLEEDIQNIE
jgi:hypothetical protein